MAANRGWEGRYVGWLVEWGPTGCFLKGKGGGGNKAAAV